MALFFFDLYLLPSLKKFQWFEEHCAKNGRLNTYLLQITLSEVETFSNEVRFEVLSPTTWFFSFKIALEIQSFAFVSAFSNQLVSFYTYITLYILMCCYFQCIKFHFPLSFELAFKVLIGRFILTFNYGSLGREENILIFRIFQYISKFDYHCVFQMLHIFNLDRCWVSGKKTIGKIIV